MMKKRMLAFALAMTMVAGMAGGTVQAEETKEIELMVLNGTSNPDRDGGPEFLALIEGYEAEHPDGCRRYQECVPDSGPVGCRRRPRYGG